MPRSCYYYKVSKNHIYIKDYNPPEVSWACNPPRCCIMVQPIKISIGDFRLEELTGKMLQEFQLLLNDEPIELSRIEGLILYHLAQGREGFATKEELLRTLPGVFKPRALKNVVAGLNSRVGAQWQHLGDLVVLVHDEREGDGYQVAPLLSYDHPCLFPDIDYHSQRGILRMHREGQEGQYRYMRLTSQERIVLEVLISHKGIVCTKRDFNLEWPIVQANINKLRKKVEPDVHNPHFIVSARNASLEKGYVLGLEEHLFKYTWMDVRYTDGGVVLLPEKEGKREMVQLQPGDFKLFRYLTGKSGEVVLFEEILSRVYENEEGLDERALRPRVHRSIQRLREILRDNPKNPKYIAAVRGGYRAGPEEPKNG